MADKSFGVKELNLLNASGTPTVTSPNNLNLNANTVAISTSCTIGNNLTVTGGTSLSNLLVSGITTFLAGNTVDVRGNFTVSGISTIPQPANANPHSLWDVVNNSASAYRFTGPGQDGAEDNPNIYLVRGQRYVFKMNASGHPFQIRVANGGAAYSDGVTNNGAQTGNVVFNVQHDAPAQLYYQCTSHGGMVGNIYIVGGPQVISGVVTATTFVGNLTGNVTGTASANAVLTGSTNDQLVTVTGANAITGESALTYSGNILKNEVSDASGLTAHILVNNSESSAGVSLLGSGGSFSSGGWAPVTDAGIIRSSAGAANGLVLQAASGDMRFYVAGSPTERVRIGSAGQIGLGGANYGTAGQVLTSQGSGSAVQWATPMSVLISSTTVSSQVSAVSFTEALTDAFSTYGIYIVTINGMRLANDDRDLRLRYRTGTNGASLAAGNDYLSMTNGADTADSSFSATSFWRMNYNNIGNEISGSYLRETFNAIFYFYGFEANKRLRYHGQTTYQSSDGGIRGQFVNGTATDATEVTGLEFYSSSGNIALGKFSLFGVNG